MAFECLCVCVFMCVYILCIEGRYEELGLGNNRLQNGGAERRDKGGGRGEERERE